MIINLSTTDGNLEIELSPSVIHKTYNEQIDFPEIEFNSDVSPIIHSIRLISSLEFILDENRNTERLEELLKENYWIDEEKDHLVIAEMIISEFPELWRDRMDVNWSYWLDAVDGDHMVVGLRADEIIERDLYDMPFDGGSLYYIKNFTVHNSFSNQDIEKNLLRYTFENFLPHVNGMVFFIAQDIDFDDEDKKIIKDKKMTEILETLGFSRNFNSTVNDLIFEIEVHKLQNSYIYPSF
ncbi:hypothetical protein [Paenibacillus hubeiensis]|uniref:hypothetical protein n=1 Tax=Paenibacillus hubeiensis TaxID=3077330 RepID=UPI0031BA0CE3